VESTYFVRDTWETAKNTDLNRINNRYYKKSLKPLMQDEQPAVWESIDKFNFSRQNMLRAVNDFNAHYSESAN
jgi:hypothetical protein